MKQITAVMIVMMILCASVTGASAEAIAQYEAGKNIVVDSCLDAAYPEMCNIADLWKDEELTVDLYDAELAASYTDDDILHPVRIYVFYPSETFDPLYLFKDAGMDTEKISDSEVTWQALWNVNMLNAEGDSRSSVKALAETLSLMDCVSVSDLQNTCYIAWQLNADSPCYVSALQPVGHGNVILYTTAVWVYEGSEMSNCQLLYAGLMSRYGLDAFEVIDATGYCG